jgi:hypothetical protein
MSSLLPPGFPTVPHDLNHPTVTPGPSQNRTWCVTPSGSQFESSTKVGDRGYEQSVLDTGCAHLLCQTGQSRCHGFSRPVSAHVSLTCSLKLAPLCSICITRPHRSYGCLRLPTASAPFLASYTCPRVRFSSAPTAGSPWLPRSFHVKLDTA